MDEREETEMQRMMLVGLCLVFSFVLLPGVRIVLYCVERCKKTDDKPKKTDDKPIFLVLNTRKIGLLGLVVSIFIANHPKMPIALHLTHNKTYA